jgi:hypothetical protein
VPGDADDQGGEEERRDDRADQPRKIWPTKRSDTASSGKKWPQAAPTTMATRIQKVSDRGNAPRARVYWDVVL